MRLRAKGAATVSKPEHQIILLALAAAMFAWVMRAALDVYFYAERTYPELLVLNVPHRELLSRVAIATSFLFAGIIVARTVGRLDAAEARAQRLDSCVRSVREVNQLVTRETGRDRLCQSVCDRLIAGRRYARVEILLGGASRGVAVQAGSDQNHLQGRSAGSVAIPLRCGDETYGALVVTPGDDMLWDDDERALLGELAEDVAFALRGISVTESLGQQKEELQTILDSVSAYISYKDKDGHYLRVNRALADVVGIPQSAWVGRSFQELLPEAAADNESVESEVMASGQPDSGIVEKLDLPSGPRWVQTDRIPYRDKDGNVIGVIGLSLDVTDRREAERALAHKEEELRQAQKIEAIGRLAGGIAHDFNNLLTAISGYAELAERHARKGKPIAGDLAAITKASGTAAALTRQLLAFSRRQPLQLAPRDLNTIVRGLSEMLRRLIGEDIELVVTLDPDLRSTVADISQIGQVILNLAVNARDAMPDGGKLTIETANMTAEEARSVGQSCSSVSGPVRLSVADTGIGMDDETIRHAFEPFFTTKGPGVGSGLGLSVVYGIVEQHGGRIRAESHPGRGTVFHVYLPSGPEPAREVRPAQEACEIAEESPAHRGARILLVEDEELVRRFAGRALRERGYEVVEARTAEEALDVLAGEPGHFDVVFSDIVLPGKSGIHLAEKVREHHPDSRVLLSSGYPDRKHEGSLLRSNGLPLLAKPYSIRGLLAALHEVLC